MSVQYVIVSDTHGATNEEILRALSEATSGDAQNVVMVTGDVSNAELTDISAENLMILSEASENLHAGMLAEPSVNLHAASVQEAHPQLPQEFTYLENVHVDEFGKPKGASISGHHVVQLDHDFYRDKQNNERTTITIINPGDAHGMVPKVESAQRKKPRYSTDRAYMCEVCRKPFTSTSNLKRHQRIHNGERPYHCIYCVKTFAQIDHLKRHITSQHTGNYAFTCHLCSKKYVEKHRYVIHMRSHSGETPFKCGVCMKSFTYKVGLLKHQRVHTGEKNYECDFCLRKFTESQSLRVHTRLHTGERPYKCKFDDCPKAFTTKKGLRIHARHHTGERPYECPTCLVRFISSTSLKSHQRVHDGIRPHICQFCPRSFTQKSQLRSHVAVHVNKKLFSCWVCAKRFKRQCNLDAHIESEGHQAAAQKSPLCVYCLATFTNISSLTAHTPACQAAHHDVVATVTAEEGCQDGGAADDDDDDVDMHLTNSLDTLTATLCRKVEDFRVELADVTGDESDVGVDAGNAGLNVLQIREDAEEIDRNDSYLIKAMLPTPHKRQRRSSV